MARWLVGRSTAAFLLRCVVAGGAVLWIGYLALWSALAIWVGVGGCVGIFGGCNDPPEPSVALVVGSAAVLVVLLALASLTIMAAWSPPAAWRVVRGPHRRAVLRDLRRRP